MDRKFLREALVVGINCYPFLKKKQDGDLNLKAAAKDAEAIANILEKYGEFRVQRLPKENDEEGEERLSPKGLVKIDDLEQAIIHLFKPPTKDEIPDVALLFFAGHGYLTTRGGIQEGFLATSDAFLERNIYGLSLNWLKHFLQDSPVQKQIVWLDCCFSGELLNFDREANPGIEGKQISRCFISASRSFETSVEKLDGKHGLFTDNLLAGLNPENYVDGWVTNYVLAEFIKEKMSHTSQAPMFHNSGKAIILTTNTLTGPPDKRWKNYPPYRGLSYFGQQKNDGVFFHGRTLLTDELIDRVRTNNFVAVLGASGSGKSSLLRAGLLYQLKRGQKISGSDRWLYLNPFTPTSSPLKSLERAINREGEKLEDLTDNLTETLIEFIDLAEAERVVMIIDQFEEAFTLCHGKEEKEQERLDFFECFLTVLERRGDKFCLVLGMRADFLDRCSEYGRLANKIQGHQLLVTPLEKDEIDEVIKKPADLVGVGVDPGLIVKIREDFLRNPGSLPLLEYTLDALWKFATQGEEKSLYLTLETYTNFGGIEGTLGKRADAVFESLSQEEKSVAKRIFLELVALGEQYINLVKITYASRGVILEKLPNERHSLELLSAVTDKLADKNNRLITKDKSEAGILLDIIHEDLIRSWKTLRQWVEEYQEALLVKRKIEGDAAEWEKDGKRENLLLREGYLIKAEEYLTKYGEMALLNGVAYEFIRASQHLRNMTFARRNPYIIGRSIDEPELFFGRESLFRFIKENLSNNQRVILLHGQRRIGKSSVLQQIPKQVSLEDQFVFILLDFQDKFQWSLDQIIHHIIQKLAQEIFEHSEDATYRIDSASIEGLEQEPNEFRKLLHSIVEKLGSKNLVLLLDEFDVFASNNNDSIFEDFFGYLQTIVSEEKQLFIIPVVGRRLSDMPKLLKLFKGAPKWKIGLLDRSSTKKLVTEPVGRFMQYNDGAIQEIIRLSAGHPYFTQAICYALFAQALEKEKSEILQSDVGRAIDKAIELSEAGLDWFREGLLIPERVVFSAVSAAQENAKQSHSPPENSLNLLENHGVKIEQILREQLLQAQQTLSENDFLDPSGYKVTVEFVRRWLIKYYPLRSEIWELEKLDDEANNYYKEADKWRIRGDIDRELEHYNMALELNPNHFSALFRSAPGHKKKQRFQKALELYERAYKIHPQRVKEEYIESLIGYGDNLIQKNGFIETNLSVVKKLYERVLEIEPYNMEAQEKLRYLEEKENAQVHGSNKSKAIPIRNVIWTAALAVPLVIGIGIFWGLRIKQDPDFILGKSELDQLEKKRFSSGEQRIFDKYNNKDDNDQFLICNQNFKKSNYKEAVNCFNKLRNSNPNDPELLIYYNNSLALQNNNNPLKIAVVVPADRNSKRAKAILRGVAQAQDEYNREYYFSENISLLEIIIANDSNDDEISPKVAQGIVRDKDILGVIGHNSSDATKAALEVYEKEKLAVISSTSTSIELKGDAFFRTVIDDSVASKKLAEYVKFRSIEKMVIFYNKESSFSQSINGFFDFYLTILKPDIKVKSIDLKQPSFDLDKEVWVAANNQVEAGALFANIGTIDLAIEIAKANYKLPESQRLNLIAGDSFYNCDILNKGGEALKGLILSIPWHKKLDTAKPFVARAKAQWGGEVGWRTATSYDATKAFISALSNSSDDPTRSKVLAKLKEVNLPPDETSGQNLKFSPEGELAGQAILVEVVASQNPACSNLDFRLYKGR